MPPAINDSNDVTGEVNCGSPTTIRPCPTPQPHTPPPVNGVAVRPGRPRHARAPPPPKPRVKKFRGTWNYAQPDPTTMRNIAVLSCPPAEEGCASGLL